MKYLLDTDHISFIQRRSGSEHVKLTARITQHPAADFAFSIINFHEQIIGAHDFINRSKTTADIVRGYNLLTEIIQGFSVATILPFDNEAAATFDSLRAQKIIIGIMDLRIAAIALSKDLVLLTRNMKDFSKVPNLTLDDWTV